MWMLLCRLSLRSHKASLILQKAVVTPMPEPTCRRPPCPPRLAPPAPSDVSCLRLRTGVQLRSMNTVLILAACFRARNRLIFTHARKTRMQAPPTAKTRLSREFAAYWRNPIYFIGLFWSIIRGN
ncbi:hypothetical protein GDO78_003315 [Eleutherodactylus coqui]|uniref:Uncharacterized protein n=1 Tax=Eleutherodactylus coqui TaxID=57060 RepID=A0A8J6ESZ3_ELECQ|nr:hypothetical protein GDO78_003315 [Eleutherodactylus coqui]